MVESDMLTTEEVLLLENLTYFNNIEGKSFVDASNEGMTVGQWLETINVGGLDDTNVYGSAMNGADWKATFSAIQANDELMDIRIAETYTDNTADGGGGRSVLFVNDRELAHFSYIRFLENRIRDTFGLEGTPIRFVIRERGDK